MRNVSARVLEGGDHSQVFKPAEPIKDALKGVGISGKHQGPSFNVELNADQRSNIAKNLYKLNHMVNNANIKQILQQQLEFEIRPLRLREKLHGTMLSRRLWHQMRRSGIPGNIE